VSFPYGGLPKLEPSRSKLKLLKFTFCVKISCAWCRGSSPFHEVILTQSTVELCVAAWNRKKQEAQLSLGKKRYGIYSSWCSKDLQGHPMSIIFMSFEKQYAIFRDCLIVILAFSLTVSEIKTSFFIWKRTFLLLFIYPQIRKCYCIAFTTFCTQRAATKSKLFM